MLGELCTFIKVGFKGRFALYYITVLSLILFGTFPNLIVRFVSFSVFITATILFLPIFTSQWISQFRLFFKYLKRERFPISDEIADLAEKMGVADSVKELGIVEGDTAYVIGNSIILGIELLKRLTYNERQAVVAHELGHIKKKSTLFKFVLTIPLLTIPLYSFSKLNSPIFFDESLTQIMLTIMIEVALLAYMMLVMIPINWHIEFKSDEIATRFVGKENIKSALLTLANGKNLKVPTETHPSISDRVKRIEKLKI